MTNRKHVLLRALMYSATALSGSAMLATPAFAQVTTAAISGQVRDGSGSPVAGATVTARNEETNGIVTAVTDGNGSYTLGGLRPAPYTITVDAGGAPIERRIVVGVGQSASLDLEPDAAGEITVIGGRLLETKTSEVATNVSQEQMRRLPQTDRNFLSFAQLSPGVQYNDSETNRGIRSGASTASGVNVFIDGVSLKNAVLDQGVAGQTDSRGNPFGQIGVQEFRVLTQNYKAEYEQASAVIVTAITKSGTNEFHGELFGAYTDKGLSAMNIFDINAKRAEPEFRRIQYGAALGGPIIKDKLFFFGAYEGNDQNRATNVILGNRTAPFLAQFGKFEGAFVSPFRGDTFFGKLTWTQDDNNTVDLSYSKRSETDIQGFGGTISREAAENKKNDVDTYLLKWSHRGGSIFNEFSMSYLDYKYNPTSLNPDSPTFEYQGIITFGGKDGSQSIRQQSMTLRDDLTYSGLDNHLIKVGVRFSAQNYDFQKLFNIQPKFIFRGPDFSFPQQAFLGLGNPRIKAQNDTLGMYIQDDWDVTSRLQVNIGLRWDRESNMFNNNYVTPAKARTLLLGLPKTPYFDPANYITDGTNRPAYNMFQPRVGFSYEFDEDGKTVLFGGFGRYYDRNAFNNTLDERFRQQFTIGRFEFSSDGLPRNGSPTVIWNPAFLTRDGLIALQAKALTGLPELFAVKNNAKPPVTDQFSLGLRQRFGAWTASLTGSYIRGRNGYTHLFATRTNNGLGGCCDTGFANSLGFANVLIGFDGLETRYKALYFTLDKPYTKASGWGFNLAYTFQKAEQNGNDLFSLDKVTPADYGFRDKAGVERHSIVLSGLLDLPLGIKFSTLTKLGSGQAFQVFDANTAPFFDLNTTKIRAAFPDKNCLGIFARCEVDVTFEKEFSFAGQHTFTFAFDVFNLFNNKNYTSFNSFICCGAPPSNFRFGEPNALLTLPRRVQFRGTYRF